MKKPILLLILLIALSSCKDDKKEKKNVLETPKVEVVVEEENVIITLNAVVPLDDTFSLQFTEDAAFAFKAKDQVKTKIIGSDIAQDITFKLPNKVIPTKIMLKVGTNNMKDVLINNISFTNDDRELKVNRNIFFQFFNSNKYIDYSIDKKTYTAKKVDGRFVPAFVSRQLLIQRLEEKVY